MERYAHSLLTVKGVAEEADGYTITGIATTPTPDLLGDEIEPRGAQFTLPMPLLWQHKRGEVVGRVEAATVTDSGIHFKAFLPYVKEAGRLKDRVDEAIHSVKHKLVSAVSIGFKENPTKTERTKAGGLRFKEWRWLELSLVDIPMNSAATILTAKAACAESLKHTLPAVAGHTDSRRRGASNGATQLNIQEQMTTLQTNKVAKVNRMQEILTKAAGEDRVTDEAEREEYDRLEVETKAMDADLGRYASLEEMNLKNAQIIAPARSPTEPVADAAKYRDRVPYIELRKALPKGQAFVRYAMCLTAAKGNVMQAHEIAKARFRDTPEVAFVIKAAVDAGTTTDPAWAGPLVEYRTLADEFIELLRPETIIGRIPGLRRVPFNIRMAAQTGGGTYQWVGQAKAKPVSELAFTEVTMDFAKVAGIIVITEELARFSSPQAEDVVRRDMIAGVAQYLDQQFIDPTVAAVADVSPASITHASTGAVTVAASGTDETAMLNDIRELFANMTANVSRRGGVWITDEGTAIGLSMMTNPLGQRVNEQVGEMGGTFMGRPLIVSNTVPNDTTTGMLIFVIAPEILLAEDTLTIDVSREASLQMDSAPTEPTAAATVLVSLWQRNLIGLKVERFINWQPRRAGVVGYISGASYSGTSSLSAAGCGGRNVPSQSLKAGPVLLVAGPAFLCMEELMKLLFQRDSYYTRAVTCGEVLDVPEKWARTYRAIGHAVEWVDAPPEPLHMETPERPPTRPTPTPEPPQRPPVQPGRPTTPSPGKPGTPSPSTPGTPRAKRARELRAE